MPALLYGIGAFALFTGLLMIGFGIPINEFSFGNTLIGAGTTASIGGLIIIGLGVVAGQLRRVAETLAMPLPGRPAQASEVLESAVAPRSAPAQGRVAFPGRPTPAALDPVQATNPFEEKLEDAPAPSSAQSGYFGSAGGGDFPVATASCGGAGQAAGQRLGRIRPPICSSAFRCGRERHRKKSRASGGLAIPAARDPGGSAGTTPSQRKLRCDVAG